MIGFKECITCKENKPNTEEFFDREGTTLRNSCKPCRRSYAIMRSRINGRKPKITARTDGSNKECLRCKKWFPNTEEYFHREYRAGGGRQDLKGSCRTCIKRDAKKTRDKLPSKAVQYYHGYKKHDARLGRENNLTPEYILSIITQPCSYCGSTENVGCDRIDNSLGHVIGNIVPCCFECNQARSNRFTPLQMKLHIGPAIRSSRETMKRHVVLATNGIPEAELTCWDLSPRTIALLEAVLPEIPEDLHFLTMLGNDAAIFSFT